MRADSRLQRFDARVQFRLLLTSPLTLQIEIAQQQARHDQADQRMAQIEIGLAVTREWPAELVDVRHRRAGQGQTHHQRTTHHPGQRRPQPRQQRPQQAHGAGRQQHYPLHEQRDQRQAHPVERRLHGLGQHQHQYQQFGEQHQAEQRFRLAQLGHEEIVDQGNGAWSFELFRCLHGVFRAERKAMKEEAQRAPQP